MQFKQSILLTTCLSTAVCQSQRLDVNDPCNEHAKCVKILYFCIERSGVYCPDFLCLKSDKTVIGKGETGTCQKPKDIKCDVNADETTCDKHFSCEPLAGTDGVCKFKTSSMHSMWDSVDTTKVPENTEPLAPVDDLSLNSIKNTMEEREPSPESSSSRLSITVMVSFCLIGILAGTTLS